MLFSSNQQNPAEKVTARYAFVPCWGLFVIDITEHAPGDARTLSETNFRLKPEIELTVLWKAL